MKRYEIEIILQKEEISSEFLIICYKERFCGSKKNAVIRAKQLQKEWNAEYYRINEI